MNGTILSNKKSKSTGGFAGLVAAGGLWMLLMELPKLL